MPSECAHVISLTNCCGSQLSQKITHETFIKVAFFFAMGARFPIFFRPWVQEKSFLYVVVSYSVFSDFSTMGATAPIFFLIFLISMGGSAFLLSSYKKK